MPIGRRCRASPTDLGHGDPGVSYSMLLAADAAGGLLAGLVLEGTRTVAAAAAHRHRAGACCGARRWRCSRCRKTTCWRWCFLFAAGFLELSFNAMAQSLVQLDAPLDKRGRVIGLFNMASLGLRAFSGISVGVLGSLIGIHWSLALSALATMAVAAGLLALP